MVTEIASRRASTGRGRDAAPTNADPGGPGTGDRRAGTGTRPGRRGADAAGTLDSADHGEDHGHSEWDAGSTSRRGLHVAQISFEGPDRYSSAGGLAVRVATLGHALARAGAQVDLHFVGDPELPAVETRDGVTLRRWCQAISAEAPAGVYDEQERKIEDLCLHLPEHLCDRIGAARARGRHTLVLAEDWHTAWPLIALHDALVARGLRSSATLVWTANNRFGFERIDFTRLGAAATLVTISRAMKHLMWQYGVNPLVVPNGIPTALLEPVPRAAVIALRSTIGTTALVKVGRWDPDKRWMMAIGATALMRDRGDRPVLLARGWNGDASASAHYADLRAHARRLGLTWTVIGRSPEASLRETIAAAGATVGDGGVVELAFPIEGAELQALYAAGDAVLANSGFEPFGLVGLEAMAAHAVVVTGATGEDYVLPFHNGFALDTDDPAEIVRVLDWLHQRPGRVRAVRASAYETARRYRWSNIVERLVLALGLDGSPRRV
jgi:glycosyltransferase involved in cell wall biosynthesis